MNRSDDRSSRSRRAALLVSVFGVACALALGLRPGLPGAFAAEAAVAVPPPALDAPAPGGRHSATAVFAGGCFWGVQGVFQHVKGVTNAVSGYSGGQADTAHYERVGTGSTGHAESVEVTFDPGQVSYGRLLQIFFSVAHDPTQLNYQGPDHGSQYRSALFPLDDAQRKVAEAYIAQLGAAKIFKAPIVTRVEPFHGFYPAEGYHQNFLTLNPGYGYIVVNDLPKIRELERLFPAQYAPKPVLVPDALAAR
jgi:peptide-methionine (S)-S-oxide reductase